MRFRPLEHEDMRDAAALLTRSFLSAPESITGRDAKDFCMKALLAPPRALMLVAQLTPKDRMELGPDRMYRIVGLTHFSLGEDTRPVFQTATPPDGAAYISSMAVDANQGIARLLIEACEKLCVSLNVPVVCLHAWSNDPIAQRCYQSCDFRFVERNGASPLPLWKPPRTRVLMQKSLLIS